MTSTLRTLLDRVEKGEGRDLSLEGDLLRVLLGDDLRQWPKRYLGLGEAITSSIDAAVALVEKVLPGWSWRAATCCVSDDAWVQPDFNCPRHGASLLASFDPKRDWVSDTDVDRRPPGNVPRALLAAMLKALLTMEESRNA